MQLDSDLFSSFYQLLTQVEENRLRKNLFHLSKSPLPFRKLNYKGLKAEENTLYEADNFISEQLQKSGYSVEKESVVVKAFSCDTSKPKAHQYSPQRQIRQNLQPITYMLKSMDHNIRKKLFSFLHIKTPRVGWIHQEPMITVLGLWLQWRLLTC